MRSAAAALAFSRENPTIPVSFVGNDGGARTVGDLMCARSVMADYGVIPISDMGTANRMWERTVDKRRNRSPLRGAPVYFPNPHPESSGHVAEATGVGEEVWTTPVWLEGGTPYSEKHLTTITALAKKCGNSYAGWGADIAGMEIDFTSAAGETGTIIIDERHLMALSAHFIAENPTQLDVFNNETGLHTPVYQADWDLIVRVRDGMADPKKPISSSELDAVGIIIQKTLIPAAEARATGATSLSAADRKLLTDLAAAVAAIKVPTKATTTLS